MTARAVLSTKKSRTLMIIYQFFRLKKIFFISFVFLLGSFTLQTQAKTVIVPQNADLNTVLAAPNNKYIILYDFNLNGSSLFLGAESSLVFRGGSINNGILIGNNNSIKASSKSSIFEKIHIEGAWKCPKIYSTWMKDCSSQNRILDIINLSSDNINNKIEIGPGVYDLSFHSDTDASIKLRSNTLCKIDGTIRVMQNNLTGYYLIYLKDVKNVEIKGNGILMGDKDEHIYVKGSTHEWGHGILISNSSNVKLKGLHFNDFTGDGIGIWDHYSPSSNIVIEDCSITNCRRQGISICDAVQFIIQNCYISDISGTAPEYAIDVEPDDDEAHICQNGIIKNNTIRSKNGIYIQTNSTLGTKNINITNNNIDTGSKGLPINVSGGDAISVKANIIHGFWGVVVKPVRPINGITINRNSINSEGGCIYNSGDNVQDDLVVTGNTLRGTIMSDGDGLLFMNNKCAGEVIAIHADNCTVKNNVINNNLEVYNGCVVTGNTINGCVTIKSSELINNVIKGINKKESRVGGIITILGDGRVKNNKVSLYKADSKLPYVFNIQHDCVLQGNIIDNTNLDLMTIDKSVNSIVSKRNKCSNTIIHGNTNALNLR